MKKKKKYFTQYVDISTEVEVDIYYDDLDEDDIIEVLEAKGKIKEFFLLKKMNNLNSEKMFELFDKLSEILYYGNSNVLNDLEQIIEKYDR